MALGKWLRGAAGPGGHQGLGAAAWPSPAAWGRALQSLSVPEGPGGYLHLYRNEAETCARCQLGLGSGQREKACAPTAGTWWGLRDSGCQHHIHQGITSASWNRKLRKVIKARLQGASLG